MTKRTESGTSDPFRSQCRTHSRVHRHNLSLSNMFPATLPGLYKDLVTAQLTRNYINGAEKIWNTCHVGERVHKKQFQLQLIGNKIHFSPL